MRRPIRSSGGAPRTAEIDNPDDAENVPSSSGSRHANLRPATFISVVVQHVRAQSAERGLQLETQARGRLAKFWTDDDPSIHYELWLHERELRLEIGFHLESDPDTNRAIYRELDHALLEIHAALGPTPWLEEWDKGWARLYETQPLFPLDDERVYEVADRLLEFVEAIEPIFLSIKSRL